MKRLTFDSERLVGTGPALVTVSNWTMAPDGETYLHFWSPDWAVITDETMPVEKFRSSERWQLAAIQETVVAVFPGCQIKSWIALKSPPQVRSVFRFGIDVRT